MNSFSFSDKDQTITVYGYIENTGQYIGKSDCYIPAHTGLPAGCTDIAPPLAPNGMAVVFNQKNNQWETTEDHRGKTVFDKETRQEYVISDLGPIPDSMTEKTPGSNFDRWNGRGWEKDTEAEAAFSQKQMIENKVNLIAEATQRIDILTDKVNLNIVGDVDLVREQITAWRKYRALVDDIDPVNPPKTMPPKPE